jgi:hypothetical protein
LANVSALSTGWQMFEQLIMMYNKTNMVGKMGTCAFMPLLHNVLACTYVSEAFDAKGGKVPEDQQLVEAAQ